MKLMNSFRGQVVTLWIVLAVVSVAQGQQNWNATVGGQSADMSKQAVAFLPDELWIHAGNSITWTFNSSDIHTVTFLTVGQVYPFDQSNGCPPITPSGSSFDGSSCVSSADLTLGETYQVIFPKAGNYEIVCLVHGQMLGVIHVLDPTLPLPYDQAFYDEQAKEQLKGDGSRKVGSAPRIPAGTSDREHPSHARFPLPTTLLHRRGEKIG